MNKEGAVHISKSSHKPESKFLRFFKSKLGLILIVLIILIFANVVYIFFYYSKPCATFECFQTRMIDCQRTTYINEDVEATWRYSIIGVKQNFCAVNVKLLQAKKGDLQIDKLAGYDMICSYPLGVGTYPEKDLKNCHGRLKEELQTIVIEKLHTNILENIGQIKETISSLL